MKKEALGWRIARDILIALGFGAHVPGGGEYL